MGEKTKRIRREKERAEKEQAKIIEKQKGVQLKQQKQEDQIARNKPTQMEATANVLIEEEIQKVNEDNLQIKEHTRLALLPENGFYSEENENVEQTRNANEELQQMLDNNIQIKNAGIDNTSSEQPSNTTDQLQRKPKFNLNPFETNETDFTGDTANLDANINDKKFETKQHVSQQDIGLELKPMENSNPFEEESITE